MFTDQKQGTLVSLSDAPVFKMVITSNIVLKNGIRTQVVTFLPKGINFDDMSPGLNEGLFNTGCVMAIQNNVSILTKSKEIELFCEYHPDFGGKSHK